MLFLESEFFDSVYLLGELVFAFVDATVRTLAHFFKELVFFIKGVYQTNGILRMLLTYRVNLDVRVD
mgnify:CR=1 FL=1